MFRPGLTCAGDWGASAQNCRWVLNNNIYRQFSHLSISVEEIEKLKIDFTIEQIESVLDQVQNFSGNKKYTSLYLTAKNWLKKNQPKQQEGISPEELKAIKLGFLKPTKW